MDCKDVQEELLASIKGEVSPDVMRDIQGHLQACNSCRAQEERIMKTLTAVHTVEDYVPSDESWLRLETAIQCLVRQQKADGTEKRFAGGGKTAKKSSFATYFFGGVILAGIIAFVALFIIQRTDTIATLHSSAGGFNLLRSKETLDGRKARLPVGIRLGDILTVGDDGSAVSEVRFSQSDNAKFFAGSKVHFLDEKKVFLIEGSALCEMTSGRSFSVVTDDGVVEVKDASFRIWIENGITYVKIRKGSVSLVSLKGGKKLLGDDAQQIYSFNDESGMPIALPMPNLRLTMEVPVGDAELGDRGFPLEAIFTLYNDGDRDVVVNAHLPDFQRFMTKVSPSSGGGGRVVSLPLFRELTPRDTRTGQIILGPGKFYRFIARGIIRYAEPGIYLVRGYYRDDRVLPGKTVEVAEPVRIRVKKK